MSVAQKRYGPNTIATGIARGLTNGAMKRVVVSFPEETFDEIRARAVKEGTSFAEQVRTLTEWGLESGT